jgi:hypothetical protein
MPWPSISDYQEAIQYPRVSLADPELKQATPVCNRLGLPMPITGGFASVYQLRRETPGARSRRTWWAIRCFLRSFADQQQRYAAIAAHLRGAVSYKTRFEYQTQGIRIRGEWYPILKMEWVPGTLLNEHVETLLGDAAALRRLAEEWSALFHAMKQARIAHGDLQHGNILVVGGKLRLIDYDGMYVPALAPIGSHESGHPSYQHPARGAGDYGPEMDRFAALVIHVALLALACEPALWARFNNGDNLLFRARDFQDPAGSPLFQALYAIQNPELRDRVIRLQVAAAGPLAQVPELEPRPEPAAPAPLKSGLPEWVAQHLMTPRQLGSPRPFAGRLLWRLPKARTSAAAPPRWPSWLPLPLAAEATHTRAVNDVAFAMQDGALVTGGADGRAFLWAADSGRRLATFAQHAGDAAPVVAVTAVGSGLVATAAWNHSIRIFNRWESLQRTIDLDGSSRIYALAASAAGTRLAAAMGDRQVRVWEVATGRETLCLRGHTRKVLAVAFSSRGEYLVSGSADMSVRVWNTHNGDCCSVLYGHTDAVTAVAVSPDGRWIASGGRDGSIFLWDARTGQPRLKISAKVAAVFALVFTPDNPERLLSGGSDPIIRCWDLALGQEAGRLEGGHTRAVRALSIAADGRRIASCGADGRVVAWQRES